MQETVSVLIVEDELIWAKQLEIHLKNLGYNTVATYNNAADAMVNFEKINFDIALLDIRMNGINAGIALGKMVQGICKKPFIFITSGNDKETIEEALTAKPSAFLIKPVNELSLYTAIQTALNNFMLNKTASFNAPDEITHESFFIKQGNSYKRIHWQNVVALVVDGRYTKVLGNNTNEKHLIGSSLSKTLTSVLPHSLKNNFFQINRNEVVNLAHVQELKGNELITKIQSFDVTDSYLPLLREALHIS